MDTKSNAYAQWSKCKVCAVVTSYIPREGCPGTHQHQPDPKMVALALNMLKADLGPHNMIPNKDLVEHVMAMIKDEDAVQALKTKIASLEESLSASKSIYRMQVQQLILDQAPATSSKTSKDSVQEMWSTLTQEEKAKLLLLADERKREQAMLEEDPEVELVPHPTESQ